MTVQRFLAGARPRSNPGVSPGLDVGPWRVERRPAGDPASAWGLVFEAEGPLDAVWAEALVPAPGDLRPLDVLRVVWSREPRFSLRHGFVLPDGRAVELPPLASDRLSREVYTHLVPWGSDWGGLWESTDRAEVLLNLAEVQGFRLGLAPLSLATADLVRRALGFAREALGWGGPPPEGADDALALVESTLATIEPWAAAGGADELASPHAFHERFEAAQRAMGDGPGREGPARDRYVVVRSALFAARALAMAASGWLQCYLAVASVRGAAAALATLRGPERVLAPDELEAPDEAASVGVPPEAAARVRAVLRWAYVRAYALGAPSADLGMARVRTTDLEGTHGPAESCAVSLRLHAFEPEGAARGEALRWLLLAETPWGVHVHHVDEPGLPPWRALPGHALTAKAVRAWFERHPWSGHPEPLQALAPLRRVLHSPLALDDPPPAPRWGTVGPSFAVRLSPGARGVWLVADPMPSPPARWALVVRDARDIQGYYAPWAAVWTSASQEFFGAEEALHAALVHARRGAPPAAPPAPSPAAGAGSHRPGRRLLRALLDHAVRAGTAPPVGMDLDDARALLDALDAADPQQAAEARRDGGTEEDEPRG